MVDSPLEDTQHQGPAQDASTGTKRKQSEESHEQQTKRQRSDSGEVVTSAVAAVVDVDPKDDFEDSDAVSKSDKRVEAHDQELPSVASIAQPISETRQAPVRKRSSIAVQDEKQRSRRLFGSLLGTIGQTGDSRTSKRRQEIEARRKAELQREDDALLEDQQRKRGRVKERRQHEQRYVDEANMKIRHKNMRNAATFLQTRTEPRLYYKPWELRASEEAQIDDQKRDIEIQIDDELDAFFKRPASRQDRSSPLRQRESIGGGDDGVDLEKPDSDPIDATTAAASEVQVDESKSADPIIETNLEDMEILPPDRSSEAEAKPANDVDDEHMVEGDEDNVIY